MASELEQGDIKRSRARGTLTTVPAWQKRENGVAYLMMIPALVPFLLFSVLPLFWIFGVSFTDYNGIGRPRFVGLANYARVFTDADWWRVVGQTFTFAAGKLAVEIPLALTLAVLLNRRFRGSVLFRTLFFLPNVTSVAVMSVVFFFLFRPFNGVFNGMLTSLGLIERPLDFLGNPATAMPAVIFVGVWYTFGLYMMLFLAGLQTIPEEVMEAAELDGASGWRKLVTMTIPLLGATFKVVIMLALVFTLRSFDLIKVLTDGGPFGRTDVMFTYIFDYFFTTEMNSQFGYGSALGVVAAVIITIISLAYQWWARERG